MAKQKGLVLGKFMPLHAGHLALIDFALAQCDELIVLLCVARGEPISGDLREHWLRETLADRPRCRVDRLDYDSRELPATSVSSRAVSGVWATLLRERYPRLNRFFSSEPYGEYVADFLGIEHRAFDPERRKQPISGTAIRERPWLPQHFAYLPAPVRPHYVQRIVLNGTESTGKSTLTRRLAAALACSRVPEVARDIVAETATVSYADLEQIATAQQAAIDAATRASPSPFLLIDTDLTTTRAYSRFLFNRELTVPEALRHAHRADLYLYSQADAPYIQDGTRLPRAERDRLDRFHWAETRATGVPIRTIQGDWVSRYEQGLAAIRAHFRLD